MRYWKEAIEKWESWDKEFSAGLVIKWIELYRKKEKECMVCRKVYANVQGVKIQVRKSMDCFEGMIKIVKEFPIGLC